MRGASSRRCSFLRVDGGYRPVHSYSGLSIFESSMHDLIMHASNRRLSKNTIELGKSQLSSQCGPSSFLTINRHQE